MPDGAYIFGGEDYPTASDFLPKSSMIWVHGPDIPDEGIQHGCGVRISDTELVLIGGYNTWNRVIRFNIQTSTWTSMPDLITGRRYHSCAFVNDKIIVAGKILLTKSCRDLMIYSESSSESCTCMHPLYYGVIVHYRCGHFKPYRLEIL